MTADALRIICAMLDGPLDKRWTWAELAAATGLSVGRVLGAFEHMRRRRLVGGLPARPTSTICLMPAVLN